MRPSETIRRARQGDESAWQTLVDQHQQAVFRLAHLILGQADEAEDIAQEAFIRAYEHFESFDLNKPLRPWLYRITTNLAYNRRRSIARRWAALKRFGHSERSQTTNPEALSAQQFEAVKLRQAVSRMKRNDQEIIYLRYFLGLSVEETAQSIDIAPAQSSHASTGR